MDNKNKDSLLSLIKITKPKYHLLIIGIFLGTMGTMVTLIIPKFVQNILNTLKHGINRNTIILLIAFFILSTIVNAISNYSLSIFGESIVKNLREKLWKKVISLKLYYFNTNHSGELTSRIINDADQVKILLASSFPKMITSSIQVVGTIIIMFTLDLKMTLIIIVTMPLLFLLILPLLKVSNKIGIEKQDRLAKLNGKSQEVINQIILVKTNVAEKIENKNGISLIKKLFNLSKKEALFNSITGPLTSSVMLAIVLGVLGYGVYRVSIGTLTIGTMFAFFIYIFQILSPINDLSAFANNIALTKGSTKRIRELLNEPIEKSNAIKKINKYATLKFNNVQFSYNSKNDIFKNLNLTAKNNQITAFVGPSGSGKTTIFNLIERFYQPDTGTITFDNINIEEFDLKDWRSTIGYVNQNSSLMSGTIRYNLTYGSNENFSDNDLYKALKLANAYEFVVNLNDKLDHEIGENGVSLSGGQIQRITIARAFLKNPQILMLDEATSNLDAYSENVIQDAIKKLMKNRTTLVIAHRLSTIKEANNIYFVDKGKIIGNGTHEELINSVPKYKQFVDFQLK